MLRIIAVSVLALAACGDDAAVSDAPIVDAATDAANDAANDAAPPGPMGVIDLPACVGVAGVAEHCTLHTNATACTTARCTKLLVLFSGGEGACERAGYQTVLTNYATAGWAGVCIDTFDTAAGSAEVPYSDEAPRYDLALREATTGAWGATYWTGAELMIQGISHGATTPLILMARTTLDDAAHWKGTAKTAACLFDGTYDQEATYDFLATGNAGAQCTAPVPARRWLTRYCGPTATMANCDLSMQPKAQVDTITMVPAATYAIRDFRIAECGSATDVCNSDILPAAPIQATCARIDQGPLHTCTYVTLPTESHLTCHAAHATDCRAWFDAL